MRPVPVFFLGSLVALTGFVGLHPAQASEAKQIDKEVKNSAEDGFNVYTPAPIRVVKTVAESKTVNEERKKSEVAAKNVQP